MSLYICGQFQHSSQDTSDSTAYAFMSLALNSFMSTKKKRITDSCTVGYHIIDPYE